MADKVIPVKVALRIRPLVPREKGDGCTECIRDIPGINQVILGKDKAFTFDYVFSTRSPQVDIYETSVQPLLKSLFKGYNATVLAYGQTGSGKTFTMGSGNSTLVTAMNSLATQDSIVDDTKEYEEIGVIPRVLTDLFKNIKDEETRDKDAKFAVKVSFVEIYNEEIKDLLNIKSYTSEPLNIREENNTIKVVGLSEIQVNDAATTVQLLEKGSSLRAVGGTEMNAQSSRSHAIFTITLEQTHGVENDLIKSKFHLVDLAGSERQSKTKAEGMRLKEGININLGLLALGNVISVLGEDNPTNKQRHVPYRESKLTRLLQDSLGGNSHTLMIACVSPADSNMEESLNTLRYADRARKIKNKPIVNIDPQAAELTTLRQQVMELKAHIYQLTGGAAYSGYTPASGMDSSGEVSTLRDENDRLKLENQKLVSELQRLINTNRITYDRLTKLEAEKEEQMKKFQDIKAAFEHMISNKENVGSEANDQLISQLKDKLGDFEKPKEMEIDEAQEEINLEGEPADQEFALRQAKMQVQLSEYDSELIKKEMLHRKMLENILNTNKDNNNMDELKSKIESLEREKEELADLVKSSRLSDQKKDRLKQLEVEVMELKRRERESQRLVKLKEENEKHCEKLRMEIQHIKQERVKLIKQMKSETDNFRKYKQEKEKEVNQLKALERKRLVEITKLQEGNNRQEAVLRRKNEEITRIQRQLRETLEKQKQVAEKRQQTIDRKEHSLGDKLRQWISQELDLSVSLAEARINLNKLIEQRKETSAELSKLTEKLTKDFGADSDEPTTVNAQKRRIETHDMDTTYVAGSSNNSTSTGDQSVDQMSKSDLLLKIEQLKEEIECKTIQINDIQQMVIEGDQEDRTKHLFNNVHGLLEAKVLLKHLYNCGVQSLLDLKLKQVLYDSNSSSMTQELKELKKKYETMEEDYNRIQKSNKDELNQLHQHYQQRILLLCKSGFNTDVISNDDRFRILLEQFQSLEKRIESCDISTDSSYSKSLLDVSNQELSNKRLQKLKRENRKTRIIRAEPSAFSSSTETIMESPSHDSFVVPPTPDDKDKDPDWVKTPLRFKRTKHLALPRKLHRTSRSRITLEGDGGNNENKNPVTTE